MQQRGWAALLILVGGVMTGCDSGGDAGEVMVTVDGEQVALDDFLGGDDTEITVDTPLEFDLDTGTVTIADTPITSPLFYELSERSIYVPPVWPNYTKPRDVGISFEEASIYAGVAVLTRRDAVTDDTQRAQLIEASMILARGSRNQYVYEEPWLDTRIDTDQGSCWINLRHGVWTASSDELTDVSHAIAFIAPIDRLPFGVVVSTTDEDHLVERATALFVQQACGAVPAELEPWVP